ncbi:hypothetical protein PInf_018680 [Phytophthora infestans]|nr:hypothetical protein PInf_018680 [Phytophthora infestans]
MERGIPLSDCDLEPETNPLSSVPKLAFGSLPIGERRELCLLIRNFSGIEALVDLEAKKFQQQQHHRAKRRHKLALSKTVNSPKTSDKLTKSRLSDAKDQDNRYQSDNGRAYLRQGEDRQILRDGRGVAFHLSPARVHILPWEQVLVRVTCFSNMPGTYVDDIPTLNFGDVCVRSPMITRTLRVGNRGPQRARLKWKLVENGPTDHAL